MKVTLKFFLTIAFLLAPVLAHARGDDYYVSQNGSGARNGSSLANAWSVSDFNTSTNWSSSDDADKIDPGDTVYFSGTFGAGYHLIVQSSGSSGNQIILDGYEAGDCDPINSECTSSALFDFNAGSDDDPNNSGISIYGKSYITIQDMRFKDIHGGIRARNDSYGNLATYINVKRCYFYHTYSHAMDIDYYSPADDMGTRYVTIGGASGDGNYIHNCGYCPSWPSYDPGSFSMFAAQDFIISYNKFYNEPDQDWISANHLEVGGQRNHTLANGIIEYNDISGAGYQFGIAMKEYGGKYIIVRHNKFYNCALNSNASARGAMSIDGLNDDKDPSTDNKMHHIYVYGNYFYDIDGQAIIFQKGSNTCYVFSNIFRSCERGIHTSNYGGNPYNLYIYNNTFAGNGLDNDSTKNTAISVVNVGPGNIAKNNVFYKNRNALSGTSDYHQIRIWSGDEDDIELDYNHYYQTRDNDIVYDGSTMLTSSDIANGGTRENNGTWGDPRLSDPNNAIFTVASSASALVDSGARLGTDTIATVIVQGTPHPVYWDTALDPNNTDWSTVPPTVSVLRQRDYGSWEKGAYVYRDDSGIEPSLPLNDGSGIELSPPLNLEVVRPLPTT